jgi:hypothetical protein
MTSLLDKKQNPSFQTEQITDMLLGAQRFANPIDKK